jgi:hypothetical protein
LLLFLAMGACGAAVSQDGAASVARTAPADGTPSSAPVACFAPPYDPNAPPARANAAFAYDGDRHVMVLFGGGRTNVVSTSLADTWTWDGQSWTEQFPAESPPPTSYAAMAYDLVRHEMVLSVPSPNPTTPPTTWTWDGVSWSEQHSVHVPPSRIEAAMAFDPSRGGVILVGGTAAGDKSDIWLWSGNDWSQVWADQGWIFGASHALLPSPRGDGSLIDIANVAVYQFDNRSWTPYPGLGWPSDTGYVGNVTYAAALKRQAGFVRFGDRGQTWTWLPGRDASWITLTPDCSPPSRWVNAYRPALAYDAGTQQVVLFGGLDRNDTWTFDGETWTPATSIPLPAASSSRTASPSR